MHASLLARLDRLASVQLVAQTGAAIGREFGYELLRAVSSLPEDELQGALARLVASELVFQRGTLSNAVYSFKHALVQDAAYGSLLRSSLRRLHARIGNVLVSSFPNLQRLSRRSLRTITRKRNRQWMRWNIGTGPASGLCNAPLIWKPRVI